MSTYMDQAKRWTRWAKAKIDDDLLYVQRNGLKGLLRKAGDTLRTTTVNTATYLNSRGGITSVARDAHFTVTTTLTETASAAQQTYTSIVNNASALNTTISAHLGNATRAITALTTTMTNQYDAVANYLQPLVRDLAQQGLPPTTAPARVSPVSRYNQPDPYQPQHGLVVGSEADPMGIVPAHIDSHEDSSSDETRKPDEALGDNWESVGRREALAAEPDADLHRAQEEAFRRLRRVRDEDDALMGYFAELEAGNTRARAPAVGGGLVEVEDAEEEEEDEDEEEEDGYEGDSEKEAAT